MQSKPMPQAQHQARQSASAQMSGFLRRELGLTPLAVHADLQGDLLSLHLVHALAPMAQMVVREQAGTQIVQGVYDVLLAGCRARFAALASELAGCPVQQIRIAVDGLRETVTIEFLLQRNPMGMTKKEGAHG